MRFDTLYQGLQGKDKFINQSYSIKIPEICEFLVFFKTIFLKRPKIVTLVFNRVNKTINVSY